VDSEGTAPAFARSGRALLRGPAPTASKREPLGATWHRGSGVQCMQFIYREHIGAAAWTSILAASRTHARTRTRGMQHHEQEIRQVGTLAVKCQSSCGRNMLLTAALRHRRVLLCHACVHHTPWPSVGVAAACCEEPPCVYLLALCMPRSSSKMRYKPPRHLHTRTLRQHRAPCVDNQPHLYLQRLTAFQIGRPSYCMHTV
jgi:hypothetical protein